jgi:hypothetical protein
VAALGAAPLPLMVCLFCIAVFTLLAGAITAAALDTMEEQLEDKATDGVRRVADTDSVARFELTVEVDRKKAPVAVTVYKEHARVRIQVLTHELTPEQVKRIEDELAEALDAEVVDRSSPHAEEHEDRRGREEEPDEDRERVAATPESEAGQAQPRPDASQA